MTAEKVAADLGKLAADCRRHERRSTSCDQPVLALQWDVAALAELTARLAELVCRGENAGTEARPTDG